MTYLREGESTYLEVCSGELTTLGAGGRGHALGSRTTLGGGGGQSTYLEGRVGFLGYYKARAKARAPVTSIGFFKNDTKSELLLSANLMTD